MQEYRSPDQIDQRTRQTLARYWDTRSAQQQRQAENGRADQGLRSAVTGGAQMDGFIELFTDLIAGAGIPKEHIFRKKSLQLPGFFRPTEEWDLLVVKDNTLIAAI